MIDMQKRCDEIIFLLNIFNMFFFKPKYKNLLIKHTGCFLTGPALKVLSMELVQPNKVHREEAKPGKPEKNIM